MNDYSNVRVIRQATEKTCESATLDELVIGPVPTGKIWHIDGMVFVDVTSAITGVHFKLRGGGKDIELDYVTNPGAGLPANPGVSSFFLGEGQSLVTSVAGATLADLLQFNVIGHEIVKGV
jgi:hypothetical protein